MHYHVINEALSDENTLITLDDKATAETLYNGYDTIAVLNRIPTRHVGPKHVQHLMIDGWKNIRLVDCDLETCKPIIK